MFEGSKFNKKISDWNVLLIVGQLIYSEPRFMDRNKCKLNNYDLYKLVNNYLKNEESKEKIISKYGNIQDWDISDVDNMDLLFMNNRIYIDDELTFDQLEEKEIIINSPIDFDFYTITDKETGQYNELASFRYNISSYFELCKKIGFYNLYSYKVTFPEGGDGDLRPFKSINTTNFNEVLKQWCVLKITEKPIDFNKGSKLEDKNLPSWGSCSFVITNKEELIEYIKIWQIYKKQIKNLIKDLKIELKDSYGEPISSNQYKDFVINNFNIQKITENFKTENRYLSIFNNIVNFNENYFKLDILNWETYLITDMSDLFKNNTTFNDDISKWDVSGVTNMSSMFSGAFHLIKI